MATAEPSRHTISAVMETRRGRCAATVYSSTRIAKSASVDRSANAGAASAYCMPNVTCAASIAAATPNAATG